METKAGGAWDASRSFRAPMLVRIVLLLFVLPGSALFFVVGWIVAVRESVWVGLAFMAVAVLLAIWLFFLLTVRVDVDEDAIVRTWPFGRTKVLLRDIHRLGWSGGRGQLILTIGYGRRRFIQLSNLTLPDAEQRGLQDHILAVRGLAGRPLWPRMANYVDIDTMLAHKGGGTDPHID